MKLKNSILFFSFVGIAGVALLLNGFAAKPDNDPDPRREAVLIRALLEGLDKLHYQPKDIDNEFSKVLYQEFIKRMDSNKRFFLKNEIEQLKLHENQLDDQAKAGTFEFFNLTISTFNKSLDKTQKMYQDILSKPLDFSVSEMLESDGDKIDWAKNDEELRQRWNAILKYEVLNRILDEMDKQDKPDFKGEKKEFSQLEKEMREKVLEDYDRRFKRLMKVDRKRHMEVYLNTITNIFDPHTGYYSPIEKENFDIQMSGKLEGIGARLQSDGEKTTVTEIVPGGPAWSQGDLQAKDVISKVAQGLDGEFEDVSGLEIDDVVSKIRGPKGTKVRLLILKPDGLEKEITITRDVVIMEEGLAKSLLLHTNESDDKIGYIYLPKFYADFTPQGATSCAVDVANEIDKLKRERVKGIILDLRNNGGGSLRDVVKMSGLFIEKGPVVQVKSRNRKPDVMEDYDDRVQWGGPLVVMVNAFSASASEILAAAMQDYERAVIVGTTGTYGKGTVQRFFDLDNATPLDDVKPLGEMKLTVQKFYRINGTTTQLQGVTPDIILPDSYNLMELGERENEFPLQANTIPAVEYSQNAYQIPDLKKLREKSKERVSKDEIFKKIDDNSVRLRKMKDQTVYPLQIEQFKKWDKRQMEEAKKYEDMLQPIDGLVIQNLPVDLPQIQSDTARTARNDNWLKERQKDIQLYETVLIIKDMINLNALATRKD